MKRLTSLVPAVILVLIGALSTRLLGFGVVSASNATATVVSAAATDSLDQATEAAYKTASQSVVYVLSPGVGSGSGIIYDTSGDIVTNDHVVTGATSLSVTLNDGRTYSATVVGTDSADDLAVIRINASNLTPARFASAGSYQAGQMVEAVGSPLGLKQSVTAGLISGLHRVEQEQNGAYLNNAIQTSAPINPGNSGGALVTLDGVVVGMPTLVQTSSSDGTTTQNIGYAIPSQQIVAIANQIVATGKVQHTGRPYMGIVPTDDSSGLGNGFGFGSQTPSAGSGALVNQVSANGPAARAGVRQGDVITKVGATTITSANDLLTAIATRKPGDTISLMLNRNGSTVTVQLTLGELPASS